MLFVSRKNNVFSRISVWLLALRVLRVLRALPLLFSFLPYLVRYNFYIELLIGTLSPPVLMGFAFVLLLVKKMICIRVVDGEKEEAPPLNEQMLKLLLVLTYLVYPTVCQSIFKTFMCDELEVSTCRAIRARPCYVHVRLRPVLILLGSILPLIPPPPGF